MTDIINEPNTYPPYKPTGELIIKDETKDTGVKPMRISELMAQLIPTFSHIEGTTTTLCQLSLPNGVDIATGKSDFVSLDYYDEEIGNSRALSDGMARASSKLWELEQYRLALSLSPL